MRRLQLILPAAGMELLYVAILLLRNLKEHVTVFIPLALTTGLLYLIAVWLVLRNSTDAPPRAARRELYFIFVAGLIFRATLFPLFPSLSDDLFRYRWEGKAQHAGYNPYITRPIDPQVTHLRDETFEGVNGKYYTTVYGPLTEQIFRWWYPVTMVTGSAYASVLLMKLPMLAFDFGSALLLVRLLGMLGLPARRVLVYWWAPLTVIEFGASGHNDSIAVFFLLLALIGIAAGEKTWSLVALALSTLSKLFTAFLWPIVLARWLERRRWRDLIWPVLAGLAIYFPYRSGLFNVMPGVSVYAGNWRNNDSIFHIFYAITGTQIGASAAYGAAVAGMAGYLAGRGIPVLRATFIILGTVLVCASNVFPWYLTWILPLLAIYPNPAWLMLSVLVFLSYHVLIGYGAMGVWREDWRFVLLEYVPFYALLIGGWISRQSLIRQPSRERQRAVPIGAGPGTAR